MEPNRHELHLRYARDPATVQRFLSLIKPANANGCLIWSSHESGHRPSGRFRLRPDLFVSAHRFAWILQHGTIPKQAGVLHRCGRARCVRPEHLMLDLRTDRSEPIACGAGEEGAVAPAVKGEMPGTPFGR